MSERIFGQNEPLSALRGIFALKPQEREEALSKLAKEYGQSYAQIYGTASFYAAFNGLPHEKRMEPAVRKAGMLLNRTGLDEILFKTLREPEKMLAKIEASGLTGRGGAGFPVARKWESVRTSPDPEKYVFCNCSEGEPYTCKDLALLLNAPETVLAGVLICCFIVGAGNAAFYLREGYEDAARSIQEAAKSFGGNNSGICIQIFINGGAYVCGEETGLLSSAEGRRGEPRLKPPFPGQAGYMGKPTVINNAETFACIPHVLLLGPEEFRRKETKLFSVSGCGCEEGVYELPAGASLNEIYSVSGCKEQTKGAQLGGGASGLLLTKEYFDIPLTFASCRDAGISLGTGSVRFIEENESIPEICLDTVRFFMNESCGKCTPCRNGLRILESMLDAAVKEGSDPESMENIRELALYIRDNARCALGSAAPSALLSAMKNFEQEFIDPPAKRDSL